MFYLIDWPGAVNAKLEKNFMVIKFVVLLKHFILEFSISWTNLVLLIIFFFCFCLKPKIIWFHLSIWHCKCKNPAVFFLCVLKLFFIYSTNLYLSSSISFAIMLMFFVLSSLDRFWYFSRYFLWSPCLFFSLIIFS